MKNIIVLGSGRSGTSMVAGCFAKAGYYMGDELLPARDANPKGFFEDQEVNDINECILEAVTPARPPYGRGRFMFRHRPLHMQRWLACLPPPLQVSGTPEIYSRVEAIISKQPFCLKDPRFSYTLPVWRSFFDEQNTLYICVFRDPATTVESILKECRTYPPLADYHSGISISKKRAFAIWCAMYRNILETHATHGKWLFIHYDQVMTRAGMMRLQREACAQLDMDFPSASLKRSKKSDPAPKTALRIYEKLCDAANYIVSS